MRDLLCLLLDLGHQAGIYYIRKCLLWGHFATVREHGGYFIYNTRDLGPMFLQGVIIHNVPLSSDPESRSAQQAHLSDQDPDGCISFRRRATRQLDV